jgi:hypothetical protein
MQSTKNGADGNAAIGSYCARERRILVQRQVRSTLIVILLVQTQQIAQIPFAKNNDMVEATHVGWSRSASPRIHSAKANEPRSADRDAHCTNAPDEVAPVDAVPIPHHVPRCIAPADGLGDLARDPFRPSDGR